MSPLLSSLPSTVNILLAHLELLKPASSLTLALAPLATFCAVQPNDPGRGAWLFLGVALLASGCSAFNQWQEIELDKAMSRTQGRPLPGGRVSPRSALVLATIFVLAGLAVLFWQQPAIVVSLGFAGAAWYNLIYTPLKGRSGLAAFPGTLSGCILPMMGWEAAGRTPDPLPAMLVLGFGVVWQIVHVSLLDLWWEADQAQSPFPNLYKTFGRTGLNRLAASGMIGAGGLAVVLPLEMLIPFGAGAALFRGFSLAVLCVGLLVLATEPSREIRRGAFLAWHLWLGLGLLLVVIGYYLVG